MKKWFTKKHPQERVVYTVTNGLYKGTTILFFELDVPVVNDTYLTLAIAEDEKAHGGMRIFPIPKDSVVEAFKNKLLLKIGKLPKKIFDIYYLEYKERLKLYEAEKELEEAKREAQKAKIKETDYDESDN